jgi:DNA polymerase-1
MKLMVLDGNSIVNRAFYGIRMLTTRDGTPTNAVYGFINILLKLVGEESPDALCVTFDLKGPTFRHEQFEGYKAHRTGMPDELAAQLPILKEVLDAMAIPRYECEGWEADDLIGTISEACQRENWECVIVTGDRDSLQLITDTTRVLYVKTRMGKTETINYTAAAFVDEYGFPPKAMVDMKALMGDSSDNIPGVAGVGEKTALALIRQFGSVQALYEQIDSPEIRDSVRKRLIAGREAAEMSYQLAQIQCCAPIVFHPKDAIRQPYDEERLYELFQRLEFTRLIERLGLKAPETSEMLLPEEPASQAEVCRVCDAETVQQMLDKARGAELVAVSWDPELDMLAVFPGGETVYLITRADTPDYDGVLGAVFGESVPKTGHDIKDTQRMLLEQKVKSSGWRFDTALAAYLLSPTDSGYALEKLDERYGTGRLQVSGGENGQIGLFGDETEKRLAAEAEAIFDLTKRLGAAIDEAGMRRLLEEIELPVCAVLAQMERDGFLVDKQALEDFGAMLSGKIAELEREIYDLAGEEFNINSPKQLGTVLFDNLLLPAPKKTKTGYSTNAEVLKSLKSKHPIIEHILSYRELTKLKSTYADGLVKVIDADGRIRTRFHITVTATGRLSSTDPNLQNIPVRRELGSALREMFVAQEGWVLIDADYSQIELRLLAHIAGDTRMQEAFLRGEDIHAVTASQVFGVPLEEVTPIMRSRAKAVNFGIVYGISPFSLSHDIGVAVAEAKAYMESYFNKYSGVRAYMKEIVQQAKRDGYVVTLFGRRRTLPELKSSNHSIRSFGERAALNTPIQGTAADIIKIAMVRVSSRLMAEGYAARLILQVHDELIVEAPEAEAEAVKALLVEEMERAADLSVPLLAEAHIGKTWASAK